MRALSLWRPWPAAFLQADKRIENRPWEITYRGDVVFHAAQKFDRDAVPMIQRVARQGGFPLISGVRTAHPAGALVFVATVVGCLPYSEVTRVGAAATRDQTNGSTSPESTFWARQQWWAFGPWCAVLENVRPLAPIPWKGAQGWFNVPDEVVADALG
jgi:hypothetical protein